MSGEEFLNKLYKDLNLSDEVVHTAFGSKDKNEAVKRYMDRLKQVHDSAAQKKHLLERLKLLYHNKYVIKENDIPNFRDKERIISDQKCSLNAWLDYLLDENTRYPMWAKYWVFQGMLKIGTYNEVKRGYQKRVKETIAPFIDVNPEIIAKCINLIIEYLGNKELDDKDLEKLVATGNFSKLYTIFLKEAKEQLVNKSALNDGIWITYHYETEKEADEKEKQGIEPEYKRLYKSLQGYNTGWCTAGGLKTAKDQICGISGYLGGDFHIYYTKDLDDEYKVPRVAIRMNQNEIGEIRGIEDNQNVEKGLEEIIEEKIKSFHGMTKENIEKYLEIIKNMKYLTLLNKKNAKNEEFTEEDIRFIYQVNKEIKGFGWQEDPRIKQIISTRNLQKDVNHLKNQKDKIKFWVRQLPNIPENLKKDKKFILEVIKERVDALEHASEELKKDKNFILEAVKENEYALAYASEKFKNDREIVLTVVKQNGNALACASNELKNDREIALTAAKESGYALCHTSEDLQKDKSFILEVVKENGYALAYTLENFKNDREIVLAAVKQNGNALKYASKELQKDPLLILIFQKNILIQSIKNKINFINIEYFKNLKSKLRLSKNKFKMPHQNSNKRK